MECRCGKRICTGLLPPSGPSMAKPSGDYIPLGGFVFHRDVYLFEFSPMTQERLSKLIFSAILIVVTAYWLWFVLAHADRIFRH
jgi:hypothetical protein